MSFWIATGRHALVHEGADGVLDQALLVGQVEVHAGRLAWCAVARMLAARYPG